jgi:hypothetical protein
MEEIEKFERWRGFGEEFFFIIQNSSNFLELKNYIGGFAWILLIQSISI